MQQAARISDQTAVFLTGGELVEYGDTDRGVRGPRASASKITSWPARLMAYENAQSAASREAVVAGDPRPRAARRRAQCTRLPAIENSRATVSRETANRRSCEIEGDCLELLALEQPVAGDLRFVVAAFKIVTDLERVGDLATNMAEYTLESTGSARRFRRRFERLAARSRSSNLERAIEAFVTDDADGCVAVAKRDDELDAPAVPASPSASCGPHRSPRRGRETNEWRVRGRRQRPCQSRTCSPTSDRTFVIVRDLERVGDHAVNVAARTLYALESNEDLLGWRRPLDRIRFSFRLYMSGLSSFPMHYSSG